MTKIIFLSAKELHLRGKEEGLWNFKVVQEDSGAYLYRADLSPGRWFEVKGRLDTKKRLIPGIFYSIVFVIKIKEGASGWENPVNLKLSLPNGTNIERKEKLQNKPKGEWIEIPIGEFRISKSDSPAVVEFSMSETSDNLKKGIALNGVVIKPSE